MKSKKQFFRKTAESIVLGIMVVLFASCKKPLPAPLIYLGDIPEEYLATVPYQNGDVVKMMHESSRFVINYRVSRSRFHNMSEPIGEDYDYQVDFTHLNPDYPTFDMGVTLTAEYKKYELEDEESPKTGLILLKESSTDIPFINTNATGCTLLDSLEINGHMYYDVFKLDCEPYEFSPDYSVPTHSIYAATCYYNYAKGFIGIELSNNEKYWLYEE